MTFRVRGDYTRYGIAKSGREEGVIWQTQGKQSFFEKKDQKAFVRLSRDSRTKVFCFFFAKKKSLP